MNDTAITTVTCSLCWGPMLQFVSRAQDTPTCRRCRALVEEAYEVNAVA